jgi:tetratricopeptide (TPR) repeat protein
MCCASEIDLWNSIDNRESKLFIETGSDRNDNILFEGEEITFYLAASMDCNVMFLRMTVKGDLVILFPNKSHTSYQVLAGSKYEVPGFNMKKIKVEGPEGIERIKAIGTTNNEIFENFQNLLIDEDYIYIKFPEEFLKKLKEKLAAIPKNQWVTSDITVTVEKNLEKTSVSATPYIDPELAQIIKNKDKDKLATGCYIQGCAYYEQKKYDEAVKQFQKVIELSPNMSLGYYSLGLSYQAKGAFKEAVNYYKNCLNKGVKERDCYVRIGELYDQAGNKKESYLRYKHALKLTEGYEQVNKLTPKDSGQQKIYDLEIKCKNNPNDNESRMELAVIYEKLQDFKSGNYHVKMLLKEAIPLYEPCLLEKDKPAIKKPEPVEPTPAPYYQSNENYVDYYTYSAPYQAPYIPPPPPPVQGGGIDF